jgi:hypothetical protein
MVSMNYIEWNKQDLVDHIGFLENLLREIVSRTDEKKDRYHTVNIETANDALWEIGQIARKVLLG